jgi:hypothetical protein
MQDGNEYQRKGKIDHGDIIRKIDYVDIIMFIIMALSLAMILNGIGILKLP